ncbi:hypothetical protein DMZ43_12140 [Meridianimaribacter sp. CL38]|uniref:restriction endonuclease subunit S n=1 Tax=Meridianimaribacter sp. CL38 TaxID=2213021 RepID=UPI00103AD5D2|nr:restriction endonuclease subunit S [Meridianimaribacter sp. CL38]TBV25679.1 hypothetical protein DMZ43_12140 [Meridianimaribacter sp. CL38]
MGKWKEKKLSEVVYINSGIALPKIFRGNNISGDIPFYKVAQMNNHKSIMIDSELTFDREIAKEARIKIFPKGSVLIPKRGGAILTNKKRILVEDASYDSNIMGLKAKNDIISDDYLFSFMHSIDLSDFVDESTIPQINNKHIDRIIISYPQSLPEQQRIVTKLDGLFAKIDQAISFLEANLQHTQALMGSVLDGIFDKVSEEHKAVPLLKYVKFVGGSQPPKSSFSYKQKEGYVRLIQIRDYKSDKHLVYIKEDSTKKFCEEDDVMIGRYGPPVFQILRGIKGAYNVALMKAIPDEKVILKDYLYYFLMNGKIQNYIISISQRSAGQSGVNKKALEAYEIAIPTIEEQKVIVNKIKSAIPKIDKTQDLVNQNLENLKALKSSLLDQAFKGKL